MHKNQPKKLAPLNYLALDLLALDFNSTLTIFYFYFLIFNLTMGNGWMSVKLDLVSDHDITKV